eukprot:TRINITY_DN16688_c0_g1_i1.p1 TRINITY_DN16688_c0_g1~~TRINITY_DN16688_c0_g1_i1.p1  ORF type:complete len:267 (-),score=80.71 TRINITY_DN16688_c0_g1_i1:369-1103(-)
MGWIDKHSRVYMNKIRMQTSQHLLRPNLIIYLDAPVDVVQAKLKARGETTHPWLKNSPVYQNSAYLNLLYEDLLKGDYMKKASPYSRVLTYDWSDGGETEVVVEDIERLNMDYFDINDKQQKDWRLFKEDLYSAYRAMYTMCNWINGAVNVIDYLDADNLLLNPTEQEAFQRVAAKLPGNGIPMGFNEEMGEQAPFLDISRRYVRRKAHYYSVQKLLLTDHEMKNYMKERKRRKEAGEANWWNF